MGHMGHWMQTMYVVLCANMIHRNELGHTFSDSYDLVREGALVPLWALGESFERRDWIQQERKTDYPAVTFSIRFVSDSKHKFHAEKVS